MTSDRKVGLALFACTAALLAASPAFAEEGLREREGVVRLAQATPPAADPNDPNARRRGRRSGESGGAEGGRRGGQGGNAEGGRRGNAPGGQRPPAVTNQNPPPAVVRSAPPPTTPPRIVNTPPAPKTPPRVVAPPPPSTPPRIVNTPPPPKTPPRVVAPPPPATAPRIGTPIQGRQPGFGQQQGVQSGGQSGGFQPQGVQTGRQPGGFQPQAAPTLRQQGGFQPQGAPSGGRQGGFQQQGVQIGRPPGGFQQQGIQQQGRPTLVQPPGGQVGRPPIGQPTQIGRPAIAPPVRQGVVAAPPRRDNRWRNRAIIGGAVIGGAAVLGAIALDKARADDRRDRDRYRDFDDIRSGRREESRDGMRYIIEPDRRRIVRTDHGLAIRYDEREWMRRVTRDSGRVERRRDGTVVTVISRPGGIEVISITDGDGRLLRRVRRYRDGREVVLIDTDRRYWPRRGYRVPAYGVLDIAPPEVRIPRSRYIVEYRDASVEDIFEALAAPPVAELDRGYSIEEIRDTYALRQYMSRVDLDLLTFDFGRYEISSEQYDRLDRVARAMRRILEQSPDEMFLIEGHTDAVGNSEDNLSLSDRRAEEVARVLIEGYGIPAENLITQGYGEQFLKVRTSEAERANRRVAVLRITPLLDRGDETETSDNRADDRESRRDDREDRRDDRRRPNASDDDEDDGRPQNSGPVRSRRN